MANIALLYDLQKMDIAMVKARQRLRQIQSALEETDEVAQARQSVAETEAELAKWEGQRRDSELEAQSLSERISSTDETLMSGKVSNPKELESLQASLESLKRQHSTADDQSVEAMLTVEQLNSTLAEQQTALQEAVRTWKSEQIALIKEGKTLQKQYKALKQKRSEAAKSADNADINRYEQLRKRKSGVAIAPLQEDSCGACNMQVPSGVISSVRGREGVEVLCPSCGRILFSG